MLLLMGLDPDDRVKTINPTPYQLYDLKQINFFSYLLNEDNIKCI